MMLVDGHAHCMGQAATAPDQQRQTALALEQQGENAEAEAAWRTYLKTHPSSSEAYAHLGLLEARQEHYREAVPLYRKALALNPTIPGLRLNLGLALFKAGEMKDAMKEFEPAAEERASSPHPKATAGNPCRDVPLRPGGVRSSGSLSEASRGSRSAESAPSSGFGAQLPVVEAVPVRSGYLSRDSDAECRVGRGRYAGRRSSG